MSSDISDVAFTSWERLPGRERPGKPIPDLAPDLAVEILSKSNTKAEMKRKLAEYFQAGTRQVWLVDPRKRRVRVHTSPDQSVLLEENDTLLAGDILPWFRLVLTDLFPTPRRSENHPDSCPAWLLEGLSLQRLKPFHCSWGSVREVPSIRPRLGSGLRQVSSLYKPLPDRGKMHARHVEDKNRAPGQLSPAREANKNAEPNAPNSVGQKDRQELR